MIGVELICNKDSREPLASVSASLIHDLPRYIRRKHGILLGMRSSAIGLTPPIVVTEDEVSRISEAVVDAIGKIDTQTLSLSA